MRLILKIDSQLTFLFRLFIEANSFIQLNLVKILSLFFKSELKQIKRKIFLSRNISDVRHLRQSTEYVKKCCQDKLYRKTEVILI